MKHVPQASALAKAVADRNTATLGEMLTDTVRLRALLPGGPIEEHGRADVLARFHGWFADMDTVELVDAAGESVVDRRLFHYRLTLGQGSTRLACTQTLICTTEADGRLAAVDLLCSGFRELEEVSDAHSGARLLG